MFILYFVVVVVELCLEWMIFLNTYASLSSEKPSTLFNFLLYFLMVINEIEDVALGMSM